MTTNFTPEQIVELLFGSIKSCIPNKDNITGGAYSRGWNDCVKQSRKYCSEYIKILEKTLEAYKKETQKQ